MIVPLVTGQVPSDDGMGACRRHEHPNYAPAEALAAWYGVPRRRSHRPGRHPGPIGAPQPDPQRSQTPLAPGRPAPTRRDRRGHRLDRSPAHQDLGPENPISALSGGNQQKVLFGRSLRLDPKVLVLDEPTRGIDVGAKEEIHILIDRAGAEGAAVLVASTDTDELVRLAHRVVIMREGAVAAELSGGDMTVENIERAQLQTQHKVTAP
jgi:hypothetical protein